MSTTTLPLPPAVLRPSQYGIPPEHVAMRAAELPGITSRTVRDLFPETTPVIYPNQAGLSDVRAATLQAMANVDLSAVRAGDTINIAVSHSPLAMFGGQPMTEVLRTVREVLLSRTPCDAVRLRVTGGMRFKEQEEQIRYLGLDQIFERKVKAVSTLDRGVEIQTEVGPLWGLQKVYDGTWLFHIHASELREVHFHRMLDRALKPFAMSYARGETRSIFHMGVGPRSAMFLCRAIFQSEYVQSRYLASCFMLVSPSGVVGVDAANDLEALSRRVTASGLREFGKLYRLLGSIDACVAVLDAPMPVLYCTAAGIAYAAFVGAHQDLFDLSIGFPAYSVLSESLYGPDEKPLAETIPPMHPGLRRCVQNCAWRGAPSAMLPRHIPTTVIGTEQAELFQHDSQNPGYMLHADVAAELPGAVRRACAEAGTKNVLVFDNAVGGVNCSPDMAEYLDARAPAIADEVDQLLMPKWLRQRGLAA